MLAALSVSVEDAKDAGVDGFAASRAPTIDAVPSVGMDW